jgi:cytidine deaminase
MNNLLDNMFIKRFCLPSNIDIESYKNGKQNLSQCVCGNHNHIACVLQGKDYYYKKTKILSYGVNRMPNSDNIIPGIHAEHDAILKLPPLKNKKKLQSINLLVIRVSVKNKLQCSKPCNNCIQKMKFLPESKGYKIKNIYYSDYYGNIVETNLSNLENEEQYYTRYYKNICKQN